MECNEIPRILWNAMKTIESYGIQLTLILMIVETIGGHSTIFDEILKIVKSG